LSFDFGSIQYRASIYAELIKTNVLFGIPIIPSDDEACWMASAALVKRNPMIAILHSDDQVYYDLALKYNDYVSCFICVSIRVKNRLSELLPNRRQSIASIPCGIDTNKFVTTEFDIVQKKDLTCVGRLELQQKRPQDIIPIYLIVNKNKPNLRLNILGAGDYHLLLKNVIKEKELGNKVFLPGWVDSTVITESLNNTAVFLQTSNYEGMSVAVMEALSSGCSIVSTRVSGVEDLKNTEGVIYLYNTGDIKKAAELVEEAIINYSSESAQKARAIAKQYFDIESTNLKLASFIKNNLESTRKANIRPYKLSNWKVKTSIYISLLRWIKWKIMKVNLSIGRCVA